MLTTLLEPDLRLTICGIEELDGHGTAQVTHVLSILDPDYPDPRAFAAYDPHHRLTMRFHDIIGPWPGWQAPEREDVEALIEFGEELDGAGENLRHLLVHRIEQRSRRWQDRFADRGERHRRSPSALEQVAATDILEPGNRLAHRRLRAPQQAGGAREAARFHHLQKYLELTELRAPRRSA